MPKSHISANARSATLRTPSIFTWGGGGIEQSTSPSDRDRGIVIYAWHAAKKKRPMHLLDGNGKTLCQAENIHRKRKNSRPFTISSDTPAPGRKICRNCLTIRAQNEAREPDLAVLMGEKVSL